MSETERQDISKMEYNETKGWTGDTGYGLIDEDDLAKLFPAGTEVEWNGLCNNYSGWKTCTIHFPTCTEERAEKLSTHGEWSIFKDKKMHSGYNSLACGNIDIEVGEIYGDEYMHNGWDAKRYAKALIKRMGWINTKEMK